MTIKINCRIKYTLLFLLVILTARAQSQDFRINPLEDFSSNLPPLGVLIDSAMVNSPLLNQQEALIRIREYQVKSQKIDWTRYISAATDYRYGTIDNITVAAGGTTIGIEQALTSRFSIGTSFGFSLFDVLDQNRKVKIAREQLQYEEFKLEEVKKLITSEIIKLYNQLVYFERLIRIKSNQKTAQESNLIWAEKAFKSGDIDIEQYSQVVETTTGAQEEFETVKKDYYEAWYLLNELVGSNLGSMLPGK